MQSLQTKLPYLYAHTVLTFFTPVEIETAVFTF